MRRVRTRGSGRPGDRAGRLRCWDWLALERADGWREAGAGRGRGAADARCNARGRRAEQMVEVAAAQDQAAVEAVAAERPYPALGVGVRVRRLHRRLDDVDRFAAEDLVEAAAELAVAIVDQEAERLLLAVERHQEVARLLRHPGTIGSAGRGEQLDPPPLKRDEEEDVEPLQRQRLDGEKVAGDGRRCLLAQEPSPAQSVALRRRRHTRRREDRANGRRRDVDAEAAKLADDPLISPTGFSRASRSTNSRVCRSNG